jgi:hypothetical protein
MTDTPSPGVPIPPAGSDPSVTPTSYDDAAAQFMAAIKAATTLVPAFEQKHPETVKFVKRYKSFGDDLIITAIAAVDDSSELGVTRSSMFSGRGPPFST